MMKNTNRFLIALLFSTTTASAADISSGKYVGKWKDAGSFGGKAIVVIDEVSGNNVTGTIQLKGPIPCRKPYPFETSYTGDGHLDFTVDSKSNCGDMHYVLVYENDEFNGKFKDVFYKGNVIAAKLQ